MLECGTAPGKIIAMLQRTKELKVIGLDISANIPKVAKKKPKTSSFVPIYNIFNFVKILLMISYAFVHSGCYLKRYSFLKNCRHVLKNGRIVISFVSISYPLFKLDKLGFLL